MGIGGVTSRCVAAIPDLRIVGQAKVAEKSAPGVGPRAESNTSAHASTDAVLVAKARPRGLVVGDEPSGPEAAATASSAVIPKDTLLRMMGTAFDCFDENGDGVLCKAELGSVAGGDGEFAPLARELLVEFDAASVGSIANGRQARAGMSGHDFLALADDVAGGKGLGQAIWDRAHSVMVQRKVIEPGTGLETAKRALRDYVDKGQEDCRVQDDAATAPTPRRAAAASPVPGGEAKVAAGVVQLDPLRPTVDVPTYVVTLPKGSAATFYGTEAQNGAERFATFYNSGDAFRTRWNSIVGEGDSCRFRCLAHASEDPLVARYKNGGLLGWTDLDSGIVTLYSNYTGDAADSLLGASASSILTRRAAETHADQLNSKHSQYAWRAAEYPDGTWHVLADGAMTEEQKDQTLAHGIGHLLGTRTGGASRHGQDPTDSVGTVVVDGKQSRVQGSAFNVDRNPNATALSLRQARTPASEDSPTALPKQAADPPIDDPDGQQSSEVMSQMLGKFACAFLINFCFAIFSMGQQKGIELDRTPSEEG